VSKLRIQAGDKAIDAAHHITGAPLHEVFDWVPLGPQGKFEWLPKDRLEIDYEYQRDKISVERVLRIARLFSWQAFGTLIVSRRPDQRLVVVEGQHRKLAADKRADVSLLPCMVFEFAAVADEAAAFVQINTDRGPVPTYHKYRALLKQGDATAVTVERLIQLLGYKVTKAANHDFTIGCVGSLLSAFNSDERAAETALRVAVEVCGGKPVHNHLFAGLFYVERHMRHYRVGSLAEPKHSGKLARSGQDVVMRDIHAAVAYRRKGGAKIYAEAIIDHLNRGRSHQIPAPGIGADQQEQNDE
jgi:hypothetical protein